MNVSYFFFSLSSADTISTFCVVTSDYFSLIFLSFLSSFFGLPPFLIAVHARNRQIHMLVPDDDAWPRYLCRMRSRVCKCVRKSFTCTSFDDSPRCPTFHASHRRDAPMFIQLQLRQLSRRLTSSCIVRRVISINGKSRFHLYTKSIRL